MYPLATHSIQVRRFFSHLFSSSSSSSSSSHFTNLLFVRTYLLLLSPPSNSTYISISTPCTSAPAYLSRCHSFSCSVTVSVVKCLKLFLYKKPSSICAHLSFLLVFSHHLSFLPSSQHHHSQRSTDLGWFASSSFCLFKDRVKFQLSRHIPS